MVIFIGGSVEDEINVNYIEECNQVTDYIDNCKETVICCADERGIIGNIYRRVKETDRLILTVPKIYLPDAENIKQIDVITDTINQRTDVLLEKADVLLFFPGGIGTLYELLSALETKKAGEHSKPIIIANYFGIYDDILAQLEKGYQEKLIKEKHRESYMVTTNAKETIACLKQYQK